MKPIIFCKTTSKGTHTFFIKMDEGTKYLFKQNFRRGVNNYFSGGVSVGQLFDVCKTNDYSVRHTKQKLQSYLKYIEKEYEVSVLNADKRKHNKLKSQLKSQFKLSDYGWDGCTGDVLQSA